MVQQTHLASDRHVASKGTATVQRRSSSRKSDALDNVLHGPYNKPLNTLFPVDTDFMVIPNFQKINSTKGTDYLVTFEIFLENRPVFVLELKREKDFSVRSKRSAANERLISCVRPIATPTVG